MRDDLHLLLKEIPVFSQLNEGQVDAFLKLGDIKTYEKDEYLFKEGDPMNDMIVLLDGEVDVEFKIGNLWRRGSTYTKGTVTGVLPYSRAKISPGHGIIRTRALVWSLHRSKHREIENISFELMQNLVGMLTDRVRENTKILEQNEKLVALGKLSAGLAHELNNPASAIVRSSSELKKHLFAVPEKFKKVLSIRLDAESADRLNNLLFARLTGGMIPSLSLSERSSLEDEMIDWMEDKNVEEAYLMAGTFLESGMTMDDMELIGKQVQVKDLSTVLAWIDNVLNTEKLVHEIEDAAHRISNLVNAVKTYSHMDKAIEKEITDLQIGLKSTLAMLNHKLKQKKVKVVFDFPEHLPKVNIYVGEVNQVWTNLIDNAIDAVQEGGEIQIIGRKERNSLAVKIIDNGSGIPPEIQSKIYDPFFTTKEIGKGTGLGLDIARRIMLGHQGEINVSSQPGKTVFTVCFPLSQ
jgi:signal transduction histidine kinase